MIYLLDCHDLDTLGYFYINLDYEVGLSLDISCFITVNFRTTEYYVDKYLSENYF